MSKINVKTNAPCSAFKYLVLGTGILAAVGATICLVKKARDEDDRFRRCLAAALDEGFNECESATETPLQVFIVSTYTNSETTENAENAAPVCDNKPESEHAPDCICDRCKEGAHSEEAPAEEKVEEPTKPIRKSKKQAE